MRLVSDERQSSLEELITASAHARAAASAAISRAQTLAPVVAHNRRESFVRCLSSRAHLSYAVLHGVVDDALVVAVVRRTGEVVASPLLLDRVAMVERMGDSFDGGRIPAGLTGGSLGSVLTLVRACDQVRTLEFSIQL